MKSKSIVNLKGLFHCFRLLVNFYQRFERKENFVIKERNAVATPAKTDRITKKNENIITFGEPFKSSTGK